MLLKRSMARGRKTLSRELSFSCTDNIAKEEPSEVRERSWWILVVSACPHNAHIFSTGCKESGTHLPAGGSLWVQMHLHLPLHGLTFCSWASSTFLPSQAQLRLVK